MLNKIIDSRSKTFILFCFSFLVGVIIHSLFQVKFPSFFWYLVFLFLSVLIIFFRNNKVYKFFLICLLLICLGFFRYNIAIPSESEKYISYHNGEKYDFEGFISAEPDIRIEDVRYVIKGLPGQAGEKLKGKVYAKSQLYPRYNYGDRIWVECDLMTPEAYDDFRYDMYLANIGVFSLCARPQIYKLDGLGGNVIFGRVMTYKSIFAGRVNRLWHEPYASFMAGLLYGYRGGLGELQEHFNRTGITHIVAISGYNISIISIVLIILFVRLWVPRKKAFWLIIGCIFLFVVFAGANGSVVRAGIMGALALLAKYLGRKNTMLNVIVLTAVLMTIQNPFVLVWDVGFQLSFLATIGLVYLLPILENIFKKVPNIFSIRTLFLSTMSAIILTLPLILFQFGRLSVVAPFVNILVLWIIPFIMLFGFLSVLLSFVFFPLGQIIAWLSFIGLKYITVITVWFSNLPFASVDLGVPLWLVLVAYITIFSIIYKANKQLRC
ncbi:MAG: ComEC/Rec2 family competence protein [bacterium]|nr:ComEC/Rec2 family competence protein [bacterium]